MLLRRYAVAAALAAAVSVPITAHAPRAACAAGAHHAALIIDTGSQVTKRCVAFDEDSISGKDMLDRANVNVEYSDRYTDAFVCRILGVGNDQAHCPNSDPSKNWNYWEAKSGSSTYTMPSIGASSTTVHDGDVEGWVWSKATPPPYASPASVCGTANSTAATRPPDPTAATGAPSPSPHGTSAPSPVTQRSTTSAKTSDVSTTTSSLLSTDSTTTTTSSSTTTTPKNLAIKATNNDKGAPVWPLAVVGLLVAGIIGASIVISRRRAVGH